MNNDINKELGNFFNISKTFPEDFLVQKRISGMTLIAPIVEMLDTSQWDELKTEYADAQKYEHDLIESAGGYEGISDDELRNILLKVDKFSDELYFEIDKMVPECYFNYEDSLVKDFSINFKNNMRTHEWIEYDNEGCDRDQADNGFYRTSFAEHFTLGDIFECLGGVFWKGKVLFENELIDTEVK